MKQILPIQVQDLRRDLEAAFLIQVVCIMMAKNFILQNSRYKIFFVVEFFYICMCVLFHIGS